MEFVLKIRRYQNRNQFRQFDSPAVIQVGGRNVAAVYGLAGLEGHIIVGNVLDELIAGRATQRDLLLVRRGIDTGAAMHAEAIGTRI